MGTTGDFSKRYWIFCLLLSFIITFPAAVWGQAFPNKPITIFAGFEAGGGTDLTTRALAAGAEKILGVPVVVENKPGGGGTVAAALVAKKPSDGYSLATFATSTLTVRTMLLKVAYDSMKDFTYLCHYSQHTGALCVLSESPFKTINDFIAYAKSKPGLSYSHSGLYSSQQIATELLARCKGLNFRNVPCKGGSEAYRELMGKHVDFACGTGSHKIYVKQGTFRELIIYHEDKRDPESPDVPTLQELNCPDVPASGRVVVGPKGIPADVVEKLNAAFRKVCEGAEFQKILKNIDIPIKYFDGKEFENAIRKEYSWYKENLAKFVEKKK
jgi:tripartite-type tricarboxylate transporter receptor subunit TctC